MSVFPRLMKSEESNVWDLRSPMPSWASGLAGLKTKAGMFVNESTVMGLPAYYLAIKAISEDLAGLPFKVYERLRRGRREQPDHDVWPILQERFNPQMESFIGRQTLQAWKLGYGNGYAEIERAQDGTPLALWPIHPSRVTIHVQDDRSLVYEVANDGADPSFILDEDMFHLRGLGNGIVGYSVIALAKESLGHALALQQFGNLFFGHGTIMTGVVKLGGKMDPEARANFRKEWAEMYSQTKSLQPAILAPGDDYQPLNVQPEAAQFLQTRYFAVEEIARWFRMPPHMLMHLLRGTFNNIESMFIQYMMTTMPPHMSVWEQHVKMKLLTKPSDDRMYARHNTKGFLRGDTKTRSEFYNRMWHIGVMSTNDIREAEEENPVPGGDERFVPLNMQPLKTAAEPKEKPQSVPPAPERDEENIRREREESENESAMAMHFLPMFTEAVNRLLRKEEQAVTRAARRYGDDPDRFFAWAEDFYSGQAEMALTLLRPILMTVSAITGIDTTKLVTPGAIVPECQAMAYDFYRDDPEGAGAELKRTATIRASDWGTRLIQEIVSHGKNGHPVAAA